MSKIDDMGRTIYIIEITGKALKRKILLGNIRRPPIDIIENYSQCTAQLELLQAYLDRRNSDIIIGVDFNIDILKIIEHFV